MIFEVGAIKTSTSFEVITTFKNIKILLDSMKNRLLTTTILATLFMIPLVRADIAVPYLESFYRVQALFLLIPIILLEGIFAYYLFKKSYNLEMKFWYPLVIFLVANIVSTLLGALFAGDILPFGFGSWIIESLLLIPAYLISSLVELPIIYLFMRKKTEEAWKVSSITSFLANLLSYLLIIVFMLVNGYY